MKALPIHALVCLALVLGFSRTSFAACDQNLAAGANVSSAIANAAAGSTICLGSGSFGTVDVANVNKSSPVTVQSASGRTASFYLRINQSSNLRFQNLTLTGMEIDTNQQGKTKNITIGSNIFKGQTVINTGNNSNANILIDGNTFDNISVCANCYEGRVQIIANPYSAYPSGVTLTNNHFGGGGESDGIQIGSKGVVVGPGNIFDGLIQGNYGRHVDSVQGYGQSNTVITGNYFKNGDTYIMMPDGGNGEQITNNVFDGTGRYYWGIQLGSHTNTVFVHNTVKNVGVSMDKKAESTNYSKGNVARDNIMIGGAAFKTTDSNGVQSCSNCVFESNLFSSASSAIGTNNVIGTPTFVGGANPTTWEGWQLTSTSLGYRKATDGKDMGANYFGGATSSPPTTTLAPPANLRVTP